MSKKVLRKPHHPGTTLAGGLLGMVLAYAFLSRALDTGSYWQYLGAVLLLILGIKLIIRAFKK